SRASVCAASASHRASMPSPASRAGTMTEIAAGIGPSMPAVTPRPTVGHVVREWLPGSETFVHTAVRHQRRVRPVVLTDRVTAADAFPVDELVDIGVAHDGVRRRVQRARTRRRGYSTAWHERLAAAARRAGCGLLHAHFGPIGFRALEVAERSALPLVTTFYGFDLALPGRDPRWAQQYARLFAAGAAFVVEGEHMAGTL